LFAGFLKFAGLTQQVSIDDTSVQARLHRGPGGTHLWATNPARTSKQVTITLASGDFSSAEDVWGGAAITQSGRRLTVTVAARDAVVAALR
jgi:beta-galactosidase